MRKSLLLTSLLLILSIGTLYGTNHWLNAQKDAIEIEETTLMGDKSAAKGVSIKSMTHSVYHLFWDTQFTIEDSLDLKTTFTFSQAVKDEPRVRLPQMNLYSNINFGISGNGFDIEQEQEQGLALKPALDVATRTQNGETKTETVALSDYYSFYPILMYIDVPLGSDYTTHASHVVTNYLKIPVPKRHKLEVSVTKSASGEITNINTTSASGNVALYSEAIILKSGCYYIIKSYDEYTGKPLEIPSEVSGIHFLPFEKTGGLSEPNLMKMKCVYPFEKESTKALSLMQDEEDQSLLLITEEDNSILLSVIDRDSMTLIQKTEITKIASDVSLSEINQFDDSLALSFSDHRFCLLSKTSGQHYELQMTEPLPDLDQLDYIPFEQTQMAYNGDRLIMAFYPQYYESSLYLIVYDKTGLAYVGQYAQNTDRTVKDQIYDNVRPMDHSPLSIIFEL